MLLTKIPKLVTLIPEDVARKLGIQQPTLSILES
jgi:hypothetical protein